jgi:SAM-dependent methyltransferase
VRYRDELSGRILEIGCGGGRLTGYLLELSEQVEGVDVLPEMLDYCRATYPAGTFTRRDLRDLTAYPSAGHDVVVAGFNVIDVLDDAERRRVLGDLARLLRPGGLLIMSSHNLGAAPYLAKPTNVGARDPLRLAKNLAKMPVQLRNHRRLRRLEHRAGDHAILNDMAHNFSLLHYYVTRDAQERQLTEAGFELIECLDLDGRPVRTGDLAPDCGELHYVARRTR